MSLYKTYIIIALIFSIVIGAGLAINPLITDFLFKEYGFIEVTGVLIAALSMVLAFFLAVRDYKRNEVWRFWLVLSLLSFLFIGESLSWGEKIFNITMPRIAGIKFDALHDALSVSIGIIKKTRNFIINKGILAPVSIAIILGSITGITAFLYLIIHLIRKNRKKIIAFFKENLKKPPFRFIFISLILILIALIVDDDNLVSFPHKEVVDEGFELLGILAFLFAGVCGLVGGKWGFGRRGYSATSPGSPLSRG